MFKKPNKISLSLKRLKDSSIKVEKVVKAPIKPINKKERISGLTVILSNIVYKKPIKKDPLILTIYVPNGKVVALLLAIYLEKRNRKIAPIAPPMAIEIITCIFPH